MIPRNRHFTSDFISYTIVIEMATPMNKKGVQPMIKIMFVCHGNICRSPMAQFVLQDMVEKKHLEDMFYITSSATSREEIGNPVHRGTQAKLREHGISTGGKRAVQLRREDYETYDYLIGMDSWNLQNMHRILGPDDESKVSLLLDFTDCPGDIADPWYSGDFEQTYQDVVRGCTALLKKILNE